MAFKLPASVYSPDQLAFCAEELQGFAASLRGAKPPTADTLSRESQALLDALASEHRADPEAIERLADELEQRAQTAPTVHVSLAAIAPHRLKTEIVDWFRANTHADVLVVFQVNPDIAGGVVVRTTSHLHDFSFRSQLLAKPQNFIKVLNRV